ncbi:MAG: aldehyde ferredoxin oxidoreductase family protein [Gammaproteobacteria bacterium]|nr:aldehyde ferredoxin oxidoreductase family protein [Gammaproteobacteria bacterium]
MGWQKNILRVNLTAGTCTNEPLNMLWAQQYLGSRGLATKYLMEEIDPKVDPLSPDNKLIIATGPLTGTIASTGGRWTAVTKGALTGAIAASNSGGQFGGELKMAGYDLIILEGRSPKPVYLYIENDNAQLLPADDLWGRSVWEIEPAIKNTHNDPLIRIASIGQAGEYGNRYACIVNDLHRAAGRSGVGAVMGSKQLKAIAVRGTKGVRPHDAAKFMSAVKIASEALAVNPGRKGMTADGTISMMDITGTVGALPTRNNRQVQFEGSDKLNAKTMKAPNENGHVNLIQNAACFACTIGCGRISHIDPKHFSVKDKPQYQHASGGLEYETAYALGSAVGVADMEAATYAGFLCNEYGMDPISFGGTLAAAMELFEIGAITEKETGGVKLNFGNAEALCLMAELAGKGEGFGRELGLGSKLLTAKYGHPDLSMAVKGQEFAAYDGRAMQGMGLGYATSNRGACHLRANPYASDFTTQEIAEKPEVVRSSQDLISAIDSSGLCLFTLHSGALPEHYALQLDGAIEGGWDLARFNETGERIWNLERQFNLAAGLTAADDTLPKRILEEPAPSGVAKGKVSELKAMLPEYYAQRGWTPDGKPTAETLKRLGLA